MVSPPVVVGPSERPDVVHAYAVAGRAHLAEHLPDGATLTGYSTHISTAVPDAVVRRVATLVVRHLSPALMLLLDRSTSPGLLIRPRPGRLEVCGEFAQGRALRLAVAVVVAAGQVCEEAAKTVGTTPAKLRMRTERSKQRFGTYVDRSAFGPDLYADGPLRGAAPPRRHGDRRRAPGGGRGAARRPAALLADDDLAALHAVVAGDRAVAVRAGVARSGRRAAGRRPRRPTWGRAAPGTSSSSSCTRPGGPTS